jgi:DNA-binding protein HU-beta
MTRRELIEEVIVRTGLSRADAAAAVQALVGAVTEALSRGEEVTLRGLGRFYPRYRKSRKGQHIKAKKVVIIPARVSLSFRPSASINKKLQTNPDLLKRLEEV